MVNDATNVCFDLDEELQDNLCKLWDMSMNQVCGLIW